jgi:16S rRNA (cytidine1402-2'-O)-methyltransferase
VGTLYLVATPIGNLEDISARALSILGRVPLIAAEDTRQTRKLLGHYGICTPLISYHEHSKLSKLDEIISALAQGDVALVSDAGTPALNDPGYELVSNALQAGHTVSPVPGPSAPIAALIASGLPTDAFLYLGYLPRKRNDRRRLIREIASLPYTLIFLETPHRLLDALNDLHVILGDRRIGVARELTKLHEEIFRGLISEALAHFNEQNPRGEFTIVIAGYTSAPQKWTKTQLRLAIKEQLSQDSNATTIATTLSIQSGWPRREVYRLLTESKNNNEENKLP